MIKNKVKVVRGCIFSKPIFQVKFYRFSFLLISLAISMVLSGQCLKGDCHNGKGTFDMGGGMKYVGDFVEGKAEGIGILFFENGDRYVGEWIANKREGRGKFHFASGSIYAGEFKNNMIHGDGKMIFARGDIYEGAFEEDRPNGEGVFVFVDGSEYVGHLKNGKFDGFGVMQYADESFYEGNWKDGKWHGVGEYITTEGQSWIGEWVEGEAASSQKQQVEEELASVLANSKKEEYLETGLTEERVVFADGSVYVGQVKNGIPFGKGRVSYVSGNKYEGYWRDNAPHGEGSMYYTSGRVVAAIWNKGEPVRDVNSLEELSLEKIIVPDVSDDVKIWALIVGISSYDHLASLKFADDDAYQMYAFLKSPEGGALPDEQLRLIIDESATIPNILVQMQSLFYKADENDVILMFYSGHGLDGSFVPIDYNGRNDLIDHSKLKEIFNKSSARHKICIADACYSGSLATAKKISEDSLKKYYSEYEKAAPGTAFLLSSKDKEVSLEDRGLKQGIFTHFLIRGMKGEADLDDNGITNIGELYSFLKEAVVKYTAGAQTPILSGSFDKNMPLGIKRSYLDY